jgi:chorismate synthase
MSVGAVKGIEIGEGFRAAGMLGSQNNDPITPEGYESNHAGGILGGISTGMEIVIRAAVKPIPSISKPQRTVDSSGKQAIIKVRGRHDISAIPRIVPVLEAMTLLVLADFVLHPEKPSRKDRARTIRIAASYAYSGDPKRSEGPQRSGTREVQGRCR